ncbi:MAG: peptidoglycan DD-metalloendopeptidase family protein [Oscillospiraceae bacterium]|nr:peptidoglycan DD-metalloendopeptidase family protein [Oscillospiraceae bacterium]
MRTTKFFISILTVAALTVTSAFSVSADNAAEYGGYDSPFTAQTATERVVPSADPDFEEITLEEFKAQYPNYKGIKEPRRNVNSSVYAVTPDPGYVTSKYSGPFVWKQVGSRWYLYASNGSTKVSTGGWYQENGYWYFLYPTGAKKYDGTTAAGEMAVGWEKIGSYWYYFSSAGIMQTDWTYISSGYYYFRRANEGSYPMGSMLVGAFYLNSEPGSSTKDRNYYFDANGKLQEWNYPLNTSKQTNKALSRNIRFDKNHVANNHQGSDIISSLKEPVRNIVAGKVEYASKYGSTGNTVIVSATELSPTLYIRYFHMDSLAGGIEGKSIPRNELIGYVGNTGTDCYGTHLHIDISAKKAFNTNGPIGLLPNDALNPLAFFTLSKSDYTITNGILFGEDMN